MAGFAGLVTLRWSSKGSAFVPTAKEVLSRWPSASPPAAGHGAEQPRLGHPQHRVTLTPASLWHSAPTEQMLPVTVTGAQAGGLPHVLPGSPDWCAPQKGLVLEVSSCAGDR